MAEQQGPVATIEFDKQIEFSWPESDEAQAARFTVTGSISADELERFVDTLRKLDAFMRRRRRNRRGG